MRPRGAVAGARPLSPAMVTVPYDDSTRRVGPFEMLPATAAGVCSNTDVPNTLVLDALCCTVGPRVWPVLSLVNAAREPQGTLQTTSYSSRYGEILFATVLNISDIGETPLKMCNQS